VTLRWKDGRLGLPNGAALYVSVRGVRGRVRWSEGALELHRASPLDDSLELGGRSLDAADGDDTDNTIELAVLHPISSPEHIWIPHLTPEPNNVIGDSVFRSPAIVLSDGELALAFIPDLDDVSRAVGWRAWLDYDHPNRTVTLGAGSYSEVGHVLFLRRPARGRGSGVALRLHVVASRREQDCKNPYGMAARWTWKRWGHVRHANAEKLPVSRHMERIVRWAFSHDGWGESVWQSVDLPDGTVAGAPVFIVDVTQHPSVPVKERRWREPQSIWNQAWFSTQRCANGLLRYARQTGSTDLEARAHRMTRVTLAAPQSDGLFPAVLVKGKPGDEGAWRWSNSNRRPQSVSEDACHIVDAAFTCRMLLEWHALTADPRALAYVRRFVDRLVLLQRSSGAFPGWVEPDGRVPPELAEGPETAVSVTLLMELSALAAATGTVSAAWRTQALAGLSFLDQVVREGRWEDFETYYSCAPWGAPEFVGRRVSRNGVYKQNTLSIFWCAEAFLHAWRATRNRSYLRLARRCVDELSLYQAVWDPPFLPAPAHGGFGVMNADCEWNDARQSLFAPLYLDLARELPQRRGPRQRQLQLRQLGDRELIERGVSALRASFSMLYCPENATLARAYERRFPFFGPESYGFMMENQGHNSAEPIGTFTIFTWGNGSALATAATVRDRFPEIVREYELQ
jgi:hypothetical protein